MIGGIATWLQLESNVIAAATKHGGIQHLIRAAVSFRTGTVVAAAYPPAQSEICRQGKALHRRASHAARGGSGGIAQIHRGRPRNWGQQDEY
jgi:hypothetical protein